MGVPGPAVQAADHSMLGIARTSSLRLGVPECLRTGAPNARRQMFAQQPGASEHSKMLGRTRRGGHGRWRSRRARRRAWRGASTRALRPSSEAAERCSASPGWCGSAHCAKTTSRSAEHPAEDTKGGKRRGEARALFPGAVGHEEVDGAGRVHHFRERAHGVQAHLLGRLALHTNPMRSQRRLRQGAEKRLTSRRSASSGSM